MAQGFKDLPPVDRKINERVLFSFLNIGEIANDIVEGFIKWIVSCEIDFLLKEGCFFHPKAVPDKIEMWLKENPVFKKAINLESQYQEIEQWCHETLFTSLRQHKFSLEAREIRVDLRNLFVVFTGEIVPYTKEVEQDTKSDSEMNGLRADAVQIHKTKDSDRIKKGKLEKLAKKYTDFILKNTILRDLIGNAKDICAVVKSFQR